MSRGLRLHKEHGVNPTISQCIICGGEKNELVLLGANYKERAPMHMITSLEPCEACREKYLKTGIMLAEATGEKHTPTGRIMVITEDCFRRCMNVPVPAGRIALIEDIAFQRFQAEAQAAGAV